MGSGKVVGEGDLWELSGRSVDGWWVVGRWWWGDLVKFVHLFSDHLVSSDWSGTPEAV